MNPIFEDQEKFDELLSRLPFAIEECENLVRADNKTNPFVGTLREWVFGGLIKEIYGEDVIEFFGMAKGVDFNIYGEPISFKTNRNYDINLSWNAADISAEKFKKEFVPVYPLLFLKVNINRTKKHIKEKSLFWMPIDVQIEVLQKNKEALRNSGRGVKLATYVVKELCFHPKTLSWDIDWHPMKIDSNGFIKLMDSIVSDSKKNMDQYQKTQIFHKENPIIKSSNILSINDIY
jgi:hypothetical protein